MCIAFVCSSYVSFFVLLTPVNAVAMDNDNIFKNMHVLSEKKKMMHSKTTANVHFDVQNEPKFFDSYYHKKTTWK